MKIRHVVDAGLIAHGHHVALRLLRWELIGLISTLDGLLRIRPRREVLLLLQTLRHALEHFGWNLTHSLHVVVLLRSLDLARNRIEITLLTGEGWDALVGLVHGLRRRSEAAGRRNILSRTALGAEHAVCRYLSAAGIAVHGLPPRFDCLGHPS